jgi:hypothetical protein
MAERSDLRDQLIRTLLEETLAPERHVDLSERVVARAFPTALGRPLRMWAFAAAAAAVLVVGLIVWQRLPEERDATGWLFRTAAVVRARDGSARLELSDRGGTLFGGPASASKGSDPAIRAFLGQLELTVRIPDTLPGGWQLSRARLLAPARVRLTYRRGDNALSVFLWRWQGDAAEPERLTDESTGRSFTLVRTQDLGIAFEGGLAEREIWNKAAAAFAAPVERQGEDR